MVAVLLTNIVAYTQQKLFLNKDWKFSQARTENWFSATVPGSVHQDLIANKIIEDPFYFDNELKQYWIEKTDWEYETTFNVSTDVLKNNRVNIVFEGLDTYAEVFLNGEKVLNTNNMFIAYEKEVKKHLKQGENTLKVYFHSATKINTEKAAKHPYPVPAVNEYALPQQRYSVYSRKAPYHFGWDWGPRMVTAGIWRPVYLQFWNDAKILSNFHQLETLNTTKADYKTFCEIETEKAGNYVLETWVNNKKAAEQKLNLAKGINNISSTFSIKNPVQWWCAGLGSQTLYTVTSTLTFNKQKIASDTKKIGVRTVEVVQEADSEPGKTFKIRLNGVDVFMKGSNYIPPDNLNPRVGVEHYRKIIKATVDANMNMLRVWGGAVYEDDAFYELCDEYGVLIWQDFMFACAMTPGDSAHLNNLQKEFDYNVKRLRQHPSMALWCGNNENMEGWFLRGWGKKYGVKPQDSLKLMETYKTIFYDMIPNTIKKYDSKRFYWPCSPGSEYQISKSNSISGDVHNWWIWFGKATFKDIATDKRRFVSEYGLQSYPEIKTLKSFARPQDTTFDCYIYDLRQRSELTWSTTPAGANLSNGNEMIKDYIEMYYKNPKNFQSFVYLSQLMQAEGLKQITEGHRSMKPYCWGSLYWQIDDCWPTISWSSIDYFYRWKAAHYFLKKANAPLMVNSVVDDQSKKVQIKVVNDHLKSKVATLNYKLSDFNGKEIVSKSILVNIKPNSSETFVETEINDLLQGADKQFVFLSTELIVANEAVSDHILYFDLPKNLKLPTAHISKTIVPNGNGVNITLSSDRLAKNVYLSLDEVEGFFSDNFLDIKPGEEVTVNFSGNISASDFDKKVKIIQLADTY